MSIESMSKSGKAIVSLAFVVGLGLIMLAKFKTVDGSTTATNTAMDNFISGLDDFATWTGIIVLGIVGVYLINKFAKS